MPYDCNHKGRDAGSIILRSDVHGEVRCQEVVSDTTPHKFIAKNNIYSSFNFRDLDHQIVLILLLICHYFLKSINIV